MSLREASLDPESGLRAPSPHWGTVSPVVPDVEPPLPSGDAPVLNTASDNVLDTASGIIEDTRG